MSVRLSMVYLSSRDKGGENILVYEHYIYFGVLLFVGQEEMSTDVFVHQMESTGILDPDSDNDLFVLHCFLTKN